MSDLFEFWVDEAPRRAAESGGTVVLTRPEYAALKAAHGSKFNQLLGYPLQFAKPYDWAAE